MKQLWKKHNQSVQMDSKLQHKAGVYYMELDIQISKIEPKTQKSTLMFSKWITVTRESDRR